MPDRFDSQLRLLAAALVQEAPPAPHLPERATAIGPPASRPTRRLVVLAAAATVVLGLAAGIAVLVARDDTTPRPNAPASTPRTTAVVPPAFAGNDVPRELYETQAAGATVMVDRTSDGRAHLTAERVDRQICIQLRRNGTDQGPAFCDIPANAIWPTSAFATLVTLDEQRYLIGVVNGDVAELRLEDPPEGPIATSGYLPFPTMEFFAVPIPTGGPVQLSTLGTNEMVLHRLKIRILETGECFDAEANPVECSQLHTREDFANVFINPPPRGAPGALAADDLAPRLSVCALLFEEYAGSPFESQDRYTLFASGTAGDYRCSIQSPTGALQPTTGSARRALG